MTLPSQAGSSGVVRDVLLPDNLRDGESVQERDLQQTRGERWLERGQGVLIVFKKMNRETNENKNNVSQCQ